MNLKFFLCALALCVAVVFAEPRLSLEPGLSTVSSFDWRASTVAAPRDHKMTLFLMMRHEKSDLVALEKTLLAVSDPSSPRYGQHLSLQQLGELTPISEDKLNAVYSFLPSTAEVSANPNKDMIRVVLSVEEVETLFQTTVTRFVHNLSGKSLLRASSTYTVPAAVAAAITVVGDLTGLPRLDAPIKTPAPALKDGASPWPNACTGLSGCDGLVTPAVIKQRYNVPADGGKGAAVNNSMAVAEFQGQYFIPSDISTFASGCKVNVTVDNIIGGNQPSAGVEAELDIEYIGGVSPDIPLTVIYAQEYSLLSWVNTINSIKDSPWVHSVSYGNDEKQQTSAAYMDSCNVQFQKAGVRGISILFASGDQGVCGREGCGFLPPYRFKPDFPGDSPYITTVGGTDFLNEAIGEEMTWSDSGGGFSDNFAIPSWQAKAVAAYKANPAADLPKQSFYNNTGRGYPDIAALGGQKNSYCVVTSGKTEGVAGTSASCPTAAAIFARLNGERLAKGQPTLGWLNPFIYQNPTAFNDVKTGNNKCSCGFASNGFTATEGWDPTTGFGTPNYTALAKASMAALTQAAKKEKSRFTTPDVAQF